eukprot:454884_1
MANECDDTGCLWCNPSDWCRECDKGYALFPSVGACIECRSNCLQCRYTGSTQNCVECENGYYIRESTRFSYQYCAPCMDNCALCSVVHQCDECNGQYRWNENIEECSWIYLWPLIVGLFILFCSCMCFYIVFAKCKIKQRYFKKDRNQFKKYLTFTE